MAILSIVFSVALTCNALVGVIGPNQPTLQSQERVVWEGTCGKHSMSWKQLLTTGLAGSKPFEVLSILERHPSNLLPNLEETHPRTFPWTFHIRIGAYVRTAALIRAKSGKNEGDIGITSAETCRIINAYSPTRKMIKANHNVWAVFGAYHREHSGYHQVPVIACFPFPEYVDEHEYLVDRYEIGIVKLLKTVPFSDNIKPVCLPRVNEPVPLGTPVTVSRWDPSGNWRNIHLRVVDRVNCDVVPMFRDPSSYFCVGGYEDEPQGYGPYECGGPVITERNGTFVMLGIATLSRLQMEDEIPRLPAVVTSLSHSLYQDWMQKTIKEKSALWKRSWWG